MKKISALNFSIKGFSLAEALITLLIICLITLASIPVLTKKKRNTSNHIQQGIWICTRDMNGRYIIWDEESNFWKESPTKDSCTFNEPKTGASNYAVTVVGGGGGAAASSLSTNIHTESFSVDFDGEYRAIVVGAGGQGGAKNCGGAENPSQAGGSGGVNAAVLHLLKGDNVNITRGYASTQTKNFGGASGGTSSIVVSRGGQSNFFKLEATGGLGGYGRTQGFLECPATDNKNPNGGVPNGNSALNGKNKHKNAVQVYAENSPALANIKVPYINDLISIIEQNKFGWSGPGSQKKIGTAAGERNAKDGYAAVKEVKGSIGHAGKGGKIFQGSFKSFKNRKVENIIIGMGGKGGSETNLNGFAGEPTKFGNYFQAPGGEEGVYSEDNIYILNFSESTIDGESGGKTLLYVETNEPLSNMYTSISTFTSYTGSGGSSGSVSSNDINTAKTETKFINGNPGIPGAVIIRWW